ncbi:MAG: hypothetical protein AAFN50_05915 [Pseudomonadota bacterium]
MIGSEIGSEIGDNNDTENDELDDELDDDVETDEIADDDGLIVEGAHEATVVDADVESLVAKIDNTDEEEAARKRALRRRLEEAREARESDLDSTFNFNIDEEL